MKKHSQHGIAHLGLLLFVVVAAVVGYTGYRVVQNTNKTIDNTASNTSASISAVPAIKSTADLNSVENTLNGTNLDQGLDPNSFNNDVNSLL